MYKENVLKSGTFKSSEARNLQAVINTLVTSFLIILVVQGNMSSLRRFYSKNLNV